VNIFLWFLWANVLVAVADSVCISQGNLSIAAIAWHGSDGAILEQVTGLATFTVGTSSTPQGTPFSVFTKTRVCRFAEVSQATVNIDLCYGITKCSAYAQALELG
jgi:hypothetical protein